MCEVGPKCVKGLKDFDRKPSLAQNTGGGERWGWSLGLG